jgi:hypothetical protein
LRPTLTQNSAPSPAQPAKLKLPQGTICFDRVPYRSYKRPDGSIYIPVQTDCAYPDEYMTEEFRRSHDVFKVSMTTSACGIWAEEAVPFSTLLTSYYP